MEKQTKIRIASYNVGDYSGVNIPHGSDESREVFGKVFEKVGADLWGLQEDVEFFNTDTRETAYDAVYSRVLPNYERNFTGRYNGKAFLSRFPISDVEAVKYEGNFKFRHYWYLKGKLTVDGKDITLICLHFDWADKEARTEEIRQLIEFVKTQKYCILMGDFNPEDYLDGKKLSDALFYKEEFGRFRDVGFSMANGGEFGTFDTIINFAVSPCPFDNIMVTPNMKIVAADRVAEPWMNDHALIWADVIIS